ncbi:MAG TPA: hypothetical protein VJN18_28150 [Polyangiaceae bacterium]|nr:hypothetical protein [Polyangiaceae bacterium]
MIGSFFQQLERSGVRYLLISGQATILYGAATFSEDVDIWLEPTDDNIGRLVLSLRQKQARYYKLTPVLERESLLRGHGFHFVVPAAAGALDLYLDVMGQPPRVGSFSEAILRARRIATDHGLIPTVGIKDLVEIKKTQRASDYPIIGRLALAHLADSAVPDHAVELRWALDNVFGLTELRDVVAQRPQAFAALAPALPEPLAQAVAALCTSQDLPPAVEDEVDAWLGARTAPLRAADRRYWRPIIDELRQLKRSGRLLVEGSPV